MKIYFFLLIGLLLTFSCGKKNQKYAEEKERKYEEIESELYKLVKPVEEIDKVLILFGGFPQRADDIEREFGILEIAKKNGIAVLYMNFNQKLWLTDDEKSALKDEVEKIFSKHNLSTNNVYMGGFSSGGNITLLLSDFLKSSESNIALKGIFIVDSPIDLLELYRVSLRNIEREDSKNYNEEANWLKKLFQNDLGDPESGIENYETFSPYTSQTNNIENLLSLDGLKIRFYTEPDTVWWKENRNNEPNDLNAYQIEKLANQLKKRHQNASVEYIATENKGFRANGDRHPHSWSIVDKEELIRWMND